MIENLGPVGAPLGAGRREETPAGDAFALLLAAAGGAPAAPMICSGAVGAGPTATATATTGDAASAETADAATTGTAARLGAAIPLGLPGPAIATIPALGASGQPLVADTGAPVPVTTGSAQPSVAGATGSAAVVTACELGEPPVAPGDITPTAPDAATDPDATDDADMPPTDPSAPTIGCAFGVSVAPTAPPAPSGEADASAAPPTVAGPTAAAPAPAAPTTAPTNAPIPSRDAVEPSPAAPTDAANLSPVLTPTGRPEPATADVAPASLGRLVAATMPQLRGNNEVRLSVRLDPPSLGQVTVDISTHDGAVHVVVRPSEASSTGVLDAQRSAVTAALANAGFELGGFDVRAGDQRDAPRPSSNRRVDLDLDAFDDTTPSSEDGLLRL